MSASLRTRLWLAFAGLSGAAAVMIDAYGRHHLDPVSAAYGRELITIATKYQAIHAVALVAVALLAESATAGWSRRAATLSGWAFVAGTLLFCGALYALAAGASPSHAIMAPWGGGAFILGWLGVAAAGATWSRQP